MNDLFDFYIEKKIYVTYLMEFLAALTGSLYLLEHNSSPKRIRFFVYFLWSVFFIDIIGGYSLWAYFDNYESAPFLKDSLFTRNTWYYNLAQIYFIVCYSYFLQAEIKNSKIAVSIRRAAFLFAIYSLLLIIFTGEFFTNYITPIFLIGTIFILVSVCCYFYDLLTKNKILVFYKDIFFYVFVGVLIHFLVVQPINIYSAYFNETNPAFIDLFASVLRYANIYMYGMFIIGFLVNYLYNRKLKIYE